MELGEIINTDFPYATMADIDVLPLTGIGIRYRKIVTLSDDVSFVLVYMVGNAKWYSNIQDTGKKYNIDFNVFTSNIYTNTKLV